MLAKVARFTSGNQNPVGMMLQSMLTESQFQEINGEGWVLADGRDVTGSEYATVTGLTVVPDARGMVLRGKNNGRVDGQQNPDGELALGAFQNQGTSTSGLSTNSAGSHNHGGARVGSTSALFGMLNAPNFHNSGVYTSLGFDGNHSHSISGGANETRMRNVTVNTFIKINP